MRQLRRPLIVLAAAAEAAERWAIFDPDPVTRSEIDRLVDRQAPELVDLFDGRISFGTAGLRAEVGPGPNRMNALVVRQTTVGLMAWLAEAGALGAAQSHEPSTDVTVLVGFDARADSARFADHAAAAVTASGGRAIVADAPTPTPVVAHAMRVADASAAIVITASHNPAADNGYKLYVRGGLQIVTPAEDEIAEAIDRAVARWHEVGPLVDDAFADLDRSLRVGVAAAWTQAHCHDAVAAAAVRKPATKPISVVYTAMHGVGGHPTLHAFETAGLAQPVVVESQFEPDPSFPSVPFPNPEEPGALDQALAEAERCGADLVIAHDPDADRLAVAARAADGVMRALNGDQLGALLADHLLARLGPLATGALVARSVVSGRMIDAIAEHHGARCAVTLTGFKWIARAADAYPDLAWCMGYEEAIGYCVGTHVRDKDGITAGLVAVDMAQHAADDAVTLWERLDELALLDGLHLTRPVTIRHDSDPSKVAEAVARLIANPPTRLGDEAITAAGPIGGGELPPTPGLEMHTAARSRVIVRPSGTEPKVKAYLEVVEPVTDRSALDEAKALAERRLDGLADDMLRLLS